jgi:hypothetical protein
LDHWRMKKVTESLRRFNDCVTILSWIRTELPLFFYEHMYISFFLKFLNLGGHSNRLDYIKSPFYVYRNPHLSK